MDLIKDFLSKDMKLLEIGCSAGMFLFHVKDLVKQVTGLDYDSNSANFTSEKCSCKTFTTDLDETGLKENNFDIICAFQVLEHVKNPTEFLNKVKKYLKPNGIIFIEVPNLNDVLIHAYDLPNHYNFYFHSAHLWYFTEKSLNSLMKKAGFDGTIHFTQDYNLLNHMHWICADKPQGDCMAGLSTPVLPLRENLAQSKKEALNEFIQKIDNEYKELLAKLGITSNLAFIGKLVK